MATVDFLNKYVYIKAFLLFNISLICSIGKYIVYMYVSLRSVLFPPPERLVYTLASKFRPLSYFAKTYHEPLFPSGKMGEQKVLGSLPVGKQ